MKFIKEHIPFYLLVIILFSDILIICFMEYNFQPSLIYFNVISFLLILLIVSRKNKLISFKIRSQLFIFYAYHILLQSIFHCFVIHDYFYYKCAGAHMGYFSEAELLSGNMIQIFCPNIIMFLILILVKYTMKSDELYERFIKPKINYLIIISIDVSILSYFVLTESFVIDFY